METINLDTKYLLSVVYKASASDAFKNIINFYSVYWKNKKNPLIVDLTCSEMVMWDEETRKKFNPIGLDIRSEVHPTHVLDFRNFGSLGLSDVDCFIFDPPYVNLNSRKDERNNLYGYELSRGPEELISISKNASEICNKFGSKSCIVIYKITDIHWKGKLFGHHNLIPCFENHFDFIDIVIY